MSTHDMSYGVLHVPTIPSVVCIRHWALCVSGLLGVFTLHFLFIRPVFAEPWSCLFGSRLLNFLVSLSRPARLPANVAQGLESWRVLENFSVCEVQISLLIASIAIHRSLPCLAPAELCSGRRLAGLRRLSASRFQISLNLSFG